MANILPNCFCPTFRWLFRDGLLPADTYFVGFARSNLTIENIKAACLPYMKVFYLKLIVGYLRQDCLGCVFRTHYYISLRSLMKRVRVSQPSSVGIPTLEAGMMTTALSLNSTLICCLYLGELTPTDSFTWLYHPPSTTMSAQTSETTARAPSQRLFNFTKTMIYLLFDYFILINCVCKTEAGTG